MSINFNWSTKRKLLYLSLVFVILIVLGTLFYFTFLYSSPTCFDGKRNQGETGIDCGLPCEKLCTVQVVAPLVHWSKAFKVSEGFYSAAAFVENPNINSSTNRISYIFRLKDKNGAVVSEREGETFIPNSRTLVIFEPNFRTEKEITSVDFEFLDGAVWQRDENLPPDITVRKKLLSGEETSPRLDVEIENRSIQSIGRLEVVALIFDGKGEAIGTSRTFVDDFSKGETRNLVFTWPFSFEVTEKICSVPLDVFLVFDRSGSMIFENWDFENPEPLNSAKNAALSFLDGIGLGNKQNRVGLISFATQASLDLPLSDSLQVVKNSVSNVEIQAQNRDQVLTQETNIAEGLELARSKFEENVRQSAQRVAVLFTDGKPTHPKSATNSNFPTDSAKDVSQKMKSQGVRLFSIGLGGDVDRELLQEISFTPEDFFVSSDASGLSEAFKSAAESICKEAPTTIDIVTRVITF